MGFLFFNVHSRPSPVLSVLSVPSVRRPFSHTHNLLTHTTLRHTTYSHTTLSHTTPSFTLCVAGVALMALGWLGSVVAVDAAALEASTSSLCGRQAWHLATSIHLLSLSCLSHPVFTFPLLLLGSWHVGLSSPLIVCVCVLIFVYVDLSALFLFCVTDGWGWGGEITCLCSCRHI